MGACNIATGRIRYENVDQGSEAGTLLSLKPPLTSYEPADILNYQDLHPDFPHQSTNDQRFDESQFEAYRKLGYHIALGVLGGRNEVQSGDLGQVLEHLTAAA